MNLNLIEALLLIALDDDNGRFVTDSGKLRYGISGAILMELAVEGKIVVEDDHLLLVNSEPAKSPLINEILDLLKISPKHGEIKYWVNKVGSRSADVQEEVLASLCERKILRREENKFLWFISYEAYPTEDMAPENECRARLRSVLLEGKAPEPKDLMLVHLVDACELVHEIFPNRDEFRAAEKRIKEITEEEKVSQLMDEKIQTVMVGVSEALNTILATTSL